MRKLLTILVLFTGVTLLAVSAYATERPLVEADIYVGGKADPIPIIQPPAIRPNQRIWCGVLYERVAPWRWVNVLTGNVMWWSQIDRTCDRTPPPPPEPPVCTLDCEPPPPPGCESECEPPPPGCQTDCEPPAPERPKGNNGWGNGSQDAPGNSEPNNGGENGPKGKDDGRGKGSGNSS